MRRVAAPTGGLRIGFDAQWYFEGPPSGRQVVRSVLKEWISGLGEKEELFLFLRHSDRHHQGLPEHPRAHPVHIRGITTQLSNLLLLPFLARQLRLDVLVCQNFAPLRAGCPSVVVIYDAVFVTHREFFTLRELAYFLPMRLLARRASRVCTISQSEKRRLAAAGFSDESRIDVAPLGVGGAFRPREAFAPEHLMMVAAKYRLPKRYALYVGRLNKRKNIEGLVRAVAKAQAMSLECPLIIVGAPDWKSVDVPALVNELGVAQTVRMLGFVSDEDLPGVYALAEVFCFVSWDEGFGLPLLEAMAAGVPAVVSDLPVFHEVGSDAATYVDPRDPSAIARGIDRMLMDREAWQVKRAGGIERARRFTWSATATALRECAVKAAAQGAG